MNEVNFDEFFGSTDPLLADSSSDTQSGFVAIVGRPNVGKSTLLNHLIGEKISITANKPQTTRHSILGVKTCDTQQIVYIDTPGMHAKDKRAINRQMNKSARQALREVDAVLFVVEALRWTYEDAQVLELISKLACPVYCLVNKVDSIKDKTQLLPYLTELGTKMAFAAIVPLSAKTGDQVDIVEAQLREVLPQGPFYFPGTQITDRSNTFRMAEIIREKLTRGLSRELPYALTVAIERVQVEAEQTVVHAIIWVERASQKVIVIGKRGEQIKAIGRQARLDLNRLLNTRVHLELWVKVRERWTDDAAALKNLGAIDPE